MESQPPRALEPDTKRWGNRANYKAAWGDRARIAASFVPDNVAVLEIGSGTGVFRDLVINRTRYVGADLQPLDASTLMLNLDADPLPEGQFDYAVLLGVVCYLHRPESAATKVCSAADNVIVSYCCRRRELAPEVVRERRASRQWVNNFDHDGIVELFERDGHRLTSNVRLKVTDDFEEFLMEFRRVSSGSEARSRSASVVDNRGRPLPGADESIEPG